MISQTRRAWLAALLAATLSAVCACSGGGGGDTTPIPGEAFSLLLTAQPDTGNAPLSVSFFAVPSEGVAPYTYAWDFNQDGITDSNSPSALYVYTASGKATVTVTDAGGKTVTASRTITITGQGGGGQPEDLDVRFNASPQSGNVPFNCQFTAYVSGGKAPYSYAWDFEGDGVFDSFLENPVFTYEEVGAQVAGNLYVFYPILRVRDGRGVEATNLDDKDDNGNPDFRMAINALPTQGGLIVGALANPSSGQAPLTVEFTGAVSGGSGDIEYRWSFGDGQQSSFLPTSLAVHTYVAAGSYLANVTAHDMNTGEMVTSSQVTVVVSEQQTFGLQIQANQTSGQVPFVVDLEAAPANGKEPINYQWDVFNDAANYHDVDPANDPAPGLDPAAVVTPNFTVRKNPQIHFGNTASAGNAPFGYVVRCVATDALGNTAVSNWLTVTAQPRLNPANAGDNGYYNASRPLVRGTTFHVFEATGDPMTSANAAVYDGTPFPLPWSARANAATAAHQTGITFVMGGEILDENGNFDRLVDRGDSCFVYVPPVLGTGSAEGGIGATLNWTGGGFGADRSWMTWADGVIALNDDFAPAYPCAMDSHAPPQVDANTPPAQDPPSTTLRSVPFQIVGSAAAVFVHEGPETNDEGQYPGGPRTRDPNGKDVTLPNKDYGTNWYGMPDSPQLGWKIDAPEAFPPVTDGLGVPIVYVFGGRTDATTPTDLVQKYIVPGFGSEKMPPYSQDYTFQTTDDQTDIWSTEFRRPDQDQFAGAGQNFDPQIQSRSGTGGGTQMMPRLPRPLYGLMACKVETGVDIASPAFPNGPFHYVFLFGGIDQNGWVRNEMLWWDTSLGLDPGEDTGLDGVFSEVEPMPSHRAYGRAVFIPGNPMKVALVGGYDQNGNYLKTVDVFTFGSIFAPNSGSWSTFEGSLDEGLRALGAGYHPGVPQEDWVVTLGGWTNSDFSMNLNTVRLGSPSNLVVTEGLKVAPRSNMGSSQASMQVNSGAGSSPFVSFNRYYLIGGVDENGVENFVEVCSLP